MVYLNVFIVVFYKGSPFVRVVVVFSRPTQRQGVLTSVVYAMTVVYAVIWCAWNIFGRVGFVNGFSLGCGCAFGYGCLVLSVVMGLASNAMFVPCWFACS